MVCRSERREAGVRLGEGEEEDLEGEKEEEQGCMEDSYMNGSGND